MLITLMRKGLSPILALIKEMEKEARNVLSFLIHCWPEKIAYSLEVTMHVKLWHFHVTPYSSNYRHWFYSG